MALDLKLLEERLNAALEAETSESLNAWLKEKGFFGDDINEGRPQMFIVTEKMLWDLITYGIVAGAQGNLETAPIYYKFKREYQETLND